MRFRSFLARPEIGFDLLRVYLGLGLMVRGGLVASDPALLEQFTGNREWLFPMLTAHAVVLSHLVGGLLLALGYCTRWAAAVQIPTVAGALFFVHWHEGLFARTQSTEFAALVLVALVLYAVFGSSELSLDRYAERVRSRAVSARTPGLIPDPALEPPAPVLHAPRTRDEPLGSRTLSSDAGSNLALAPDPPRAREQYRDAKFELTLVITMVCVLFVLLANAFYVAATAWMIVSLFVFGIWRIGRADFH